MDKDILDSLLDEIGEERLNHTLRVVEEAKKLAVKHSVDINKAAITALLHDCGKFTNKKKILKRAYDFDIILSNVMKHNPELIHAPLGAKIANHKYNIEDQDILNAIRYHTTGRKSMSKLEKLIYIADYIEPSREFIGVEEVRHLAYEDLDKSLLLAMNQTITFLVSKDRPISLHTIEARNQLIIEQANTRRY